MLSKQEFIRNSIEINLFFQRIMKEHLFFIETNLRPVASEYIAEANRLKQCFEQLLYETLCYANGNISEEAIKSHEFVTPYTLKAEEVNSKLTGAYINTSITKYELALISTPSYYYNDDLYDAIYDINIRTYYLLQETITFQKNLLTQSLNCRIFITLYQEMLEHDTREAEHYSNLLKGLKNNQLPKATLCEDLNFWNNIMSEHAQFIDGMLDPTEISLKKVAEETAKEFEKLVKECINSAEDQIIQESLKSTESIKTFKTKATEGLLECKIKSIIPPLLADHVLREANHYLKLLTISN